MSVLKKVIPAVDVRYFEIGDNVIVKQNQKNCEEWKSCHEWEWEFNKEKSEELKRGPSYNEGSHFHYALGLGKVKKIFKETVWVEMI